MLSSRFTGSLERLRKAGRIRSILVPSDEGARAEPGLSETLDLIGPVPLPLTVADREIEARWYVAAPPGPRGAVHQGGQVSVVEFGRPAPGPGLPLVRIHSACLTGDVLGSRRCDCGPQLRSAVQQVSRSAVGGMVVYMTGHEGRGIGLWAKAAAYLLQDDGLDTYAANRALGFEDDLREFRYAAAVIRHLLGHRRFRLLTNNPEKVEQIRAAGLSGVVPQPHVVGVCARNRAYLHAKLGRGHTIPSTAIAYTDLVEPREAVPELPGSGSRDRGD